MGAPKTYLVLSIEGSPDDLSGLRDVAITALEDAITEVFPDAADNSFPVEWQFEDVEEK